jgi:hypothetical protein
VRMSVPLTCNETRPRRAIEGESGLSCLAMEEAGEVDRPILFARYGAYCRGARVLVPCMEVCISSIVRRPSLLASIALNIRS